MSISPDRPDPAPEDLLDAFFAGELPPDRAEQVRNYLNATPERRGVIAGVLASARGEQFAPEPTSDALDAFVERLAARLDQQHASPRGLRQRGSFGTQSLSESGGVGKQALLGRTARYALTATAAMVVGALGIILFGTFRHHVSHDIAARTYSTTAGQQATVTLADGSRALLGPATTLSVFSGVSDRDVDIHVVGQALFTVSHSHERVFRVRAGNAVARVLGTTFLVRRYETDPVTRVVVTDGRVSLTSAQDSTNTNAARVLIASTLGTVDDSGTVQVTPQVDVEDYTAWTTGHLVFQKTPARDAVVELGRAYGVEIRIADSTTAAQRLTWSVPVSQRSLDGILESLVDLLDAHPVRNGRVITLVPGRAAPRRPVGSPLSPSLERVYGK